MPRIRGSATRRPRARLLSTPATTYPDHDGTSMTTTICGVKFSDQTGALLAHAAETDGWRVEPNKKRGYQPGVTVYAADKTISPINVYEDKAHFNKAHYENIRRQLYAAGLPPLPADVQQTTPPAPTAPAEETPAMPKTPKMTTPRGDYDIVDLTDPDAMNKLLDQPDRPARSQVIAGITEGLMLRAGLSADAGHLASLFIYTLTVWDLEREVETSSDKIAEVEQALALAAETEAKATRLEKALAKADERADQAVTDLRSWKERAEAAEAEAAEAAAALAPLRAFLGKSS